MLFKALSIYLAALLLIELILSIYIAYGQYINEVVCFAGSNCSAVQGSSYGEIAGIKTSVLGSFAFALSFLIYIWAQNSYKRHRFFFGAMSMDALAAIYFISLQFFVLKQLCASCLVVDTFMLTIFALSFYEFHTQRKELLTSLSQKRRAPFIQW